jgi:hypothetical protein
MRAYREPWGFAGGWAIDLFVGASTRPHADVDIAVLRGDQEKLRRALAGAQVDTMVGGARLPWGANEWLAPPTHELHATWPDGAHVELVLNDSDAATGEWVYRRDARIRLPLSQTFHSTGALPFLAPEIVLLFKSRAPAAKDDADLATALPRLDDRSVTWLREAIVVTGGADRWVETLSRRG